MFSGDIAGVHNLIRNRSIITSEKIQESVSRRVKDNSCHITSYLEYSDNFAICLKQAVATVKKYFNNLKETYKQINFNLENSI